MKKVDTPVINAGASAYPNPRAFGLKGGFWSKVQRFVDEMADIRERSIKLSVRSMELQQEREYQQRKHENACVQAARAGKDEPEPDQLERVQREIEKIEAKRERHSTAEQLVAQDLNRLLETEDAADVLTELRERARQHEERYHELVAQAQAERDALGTAYGLHLWVRGVDPNGRGDMTHRFNPTPSSPMPDGSPWHAHPLNWGDEEQHDTPGMILKDGVS